MHVILDSCTHSSFFQQLFLYWPEMLSSLQQKLFTLLFDERFSEIFSLKYLDFYALYQKFVWNSFNLQNVKYNKDLHRLP